MRWRVSLCAILLGSLCYSVPAVPGQEKAAKPRLGKPTLVVRLDSVDGLLNDFRYLAKLAGQEEPARQVEGIIQSRRGPKGLGGIDTKKPWGAYGVLDANVPTSQAVLMIPVVDQATFLETLDGFNFPAEKMEGGLYSIQLPRVPGKVFFRFANSYLYGTFRNPNAVARDQLLAPGRVFAKDLRGTASLQVNFDTVPEKLKKIALGQVDLRLADLKEEAPPGENPLQKKVRLAILDEAGRRARTLIEDSGTLNLRLNIDQAKADISVEANFSGQPDSPLAREIASLATGKSLAAALIGKGSAINGFVHVLLPETVRTTLAPVIDQGIKDAIRKETNPNKREAAELLLKALAPTAKAGELDVGFDIRGPKEGGLYTLVLGMKINKGLALEKALRETLKKAPPKQRETVTLDFARAGGVTIHKVTPKPENLDKGVRNLLGPNPLFVAFREDAVLVAGGVQGLEALKGAVSVRPTPSAVGQLQMSLGRMARALAREQKGAPRAAREAFTKPGVDDTIRLSLQGGETLKLRLSMHARVVSFFALLNKYNKEAE
jgi:hypothetical protein